MLWFSNFISYSPSNEVLAVPSTVELQDGYVAKSLCRITNREQRLISPFSAQWERQIDQDLHSLSMHERCKRKTAGLLSRYLVPPCACRFEDDDPEPLYLEKDKI